jgi:hypothetical protein
LLSPLRARAVIAVPGTGTAATDPGGTTETTPAP